MNAIVPAHNDSSTIDDERKSSVKIAGEEFELLLSTLAVKQIGIKYGGIDKIGDKLINSEDVLAELDTIADIISILMNQPIMIHNLYNPTDKRELWDSEKVMLFTSPAEIGGFSDAILSCFEKGMKMAIPHDNEESSKNTKAE